MFQKVIRPGGSAHCPECREPISQEANICPHCRSDLKSNEAWQKAKESSQSSGCSVAVFLLTATVMVTMAWVLCSSWIS
jgi:predicted amidophosphoribosyltransferase